MVTEFAMLTLDARNSSKCQWASWPDSNSVTEGGDRVFRLTSSDSKNTMIPLVNIRPLYAQKHM